MSGSATRVCQERAPLTARTKLIQDAARPQPLYTSTLDGTVSICRTEGFGGIYRGLGPTILKQASNSAVRFTSFAMLQSVALETLKPASGKLSATTTFATGALAGLITVCAWPPASRFLRPVLTLSFLLLQTRRCRLTTSRRACSPSAPGQSTVTASTALSPSCGTRASSGCGAARRRVSRG